MISKCTRRWSAKGEYEKDLQHHLFLLTFDDKLGLAPPNEPGSQVKRVLDLGTGTGIWAMDFGDEHPGTHVSAAWW